MSVHVKIDIGGGPPVTIKRRNEKDGIKHPLYLNGEMSAQ